MAVLGSTTKQGSRLAQVTALAVASNFLSSCTAPLRTEEFRISAVTQAHVPPEATETLKKLDVVQAQLEQFEQLRLTAINDYGVLLLIPAISTRYEKAVSHHRSLCTALADRKERLTSGASASELVAINEWSEKQAEELKSLLDAAKHLLEKHCIPRGWSPPDEFAYLSL